MHEVPAKAEALSAMLECLPEPALIVDVAWRIRAVNTSLRESLPEAAELLGRRCYEVLHRRQHRCDRRRAHCPLDVCRREALLAPSIHVHAVRGGWRRYWVVAQPLRDGAGEVVGCLATLRRTEDGPKRLEPPGNGTVYVVDQAFRHDVRDPSRRGHARRR